MQYISNDKIKRLILEATGEEEEVVTNIDVEAVEDVWGGDLEGEDRNLVKPLDHAEAAGSEPTTKNPESLDPASPILAKESFGLRIYYSKSDLGRPHVLPKSLNKEYYNMYVEGNLRAAKMLIESHLNRKFSGWVDYEWTTIKG